MINGKHLYLSVKSAIRTLKGRRREPAAFLVAALCFSGGVALGKLLADKWITRLQIALYAIGAIAFVYGVVRVWKLVNPPELPPAKDRPSAIKGPMAFTEADGDLFRKLERESELLATDSFCSLSLYPVPTTGYQEHSNGNCGRQCPGREHGSYK